MEDDGTETSTTRTPLVQGHGDTEKLRLDHGLSLEAELQAPPMHLSSRSSQQRDHQEDAQEEAESSVVEASLLRVVDWILFVGYTAPMLEVPPHTPHVFLNRIHLQEALIILSIGRCDRGRR